MAGANMVHEDEILGKAYDSKLMSRLLTYLRPYKKQVAIAFVLIFGITVLELLTIYLGKVAIDNAIIPGNLEMLWTISIVFVLALAFSSLFRYAQSYIMQIIGQNVMYDMRQNIFTHLQKQSLSYFDRNAVGRLISRLTNDVDALNEFIGSGVVTIAGDLVILLGVIGIMFAVDW